MNFVDLDVLATLAVASSSDVNISPSGESQRVKEFPMHRLRSLEYTWKGTKAQHRHKDSSVELFSWMAQALFHKAASTGEIANLTARFHRRRKKTYSRSLAPTDEPTHNRTYIAPCIHTYTCGMWICTSQRLLQPRTPLLDYPPHCTQSGRKCPSRLVMQCQAWLHWRSLVQSRRQLRANVELLTSRVEVIIGNGEGELDRTSCKSSHYCWI